MNYYVLDTDHLSIFQRQSEPAFSILKAKLARFSILAHRKFLHLTKVQPILPNG